MTYTGNMTTDSYTTANGGTYATTKTNSGGDVGSNGGVTMSGNATVNGIVGVQKPLPVGPCAAPLTTSGNASPTVPTYLTSSVPFPPVPTPLTPNSTYNPPKPAGCATSACMVPGTYGNISLSGQNVLTLAPGTYNINSLSMSGQSQINVSPAGAVVINIGGCGDATCSAAHALNSPLTLSGQGIINDVIPNDFIINYGGTGKVDLSGQGTTTAILNAPLAPVKLSGQGTWYGSVLGSTMDISGNGAFHYDRNAALSPLNNGYYTMISFREVAY